MNSFRAMSGLLSPWLASSATWRSTGLRLTHPCVAPVRAPRFVQRLMTLADHEDRVLDTVRIEGFHHGVRSYAAWLPRREQD